MDISALSNVTSAYIKNAAEQNPQLTTEDRGFESVLKSAMDMVNEASDLQNQAQFALGYATNTHDLNDIQTRADIALNYTTAVRDRMLEAYKEIMNMQI